VRFGLTPAQIRRGRRDVGYLSGHRTSQQGYAGDTKLSDARAYPAAMVVFSNRRLGPGAELLVSREVAGELLREVAAAAGPAAQARWEHELVSWLQRCAASGSTSIDVADIAWTPEHFERQRRFLVEAIQRAQGGSRHGRALIRWCGMVEAHPRESVSVGRRWQWPPSAITI
jgi:hypothetical protein